MMMARCGCGVVLTRWFNEHKNHSVHQNLSARSARMHPCARAEVLSSLRALPPRKHRFTVWAKMKTTKTIKQEGALSFKRNGRNKNTNRMRMRTRLQTRRLRRPRMSGACWHRCTG